MMAGVTGHDVGEGPDGHRVAAGRPDPLPRRGVQTTHDPEMRLAELFELVDQFRDAAPVEAGMSDVVVFVETRQRVHVSPTEAERAKAKHPLGVGDVAEHLAHAPLPGRVAMMLEGRHERTCLASELARLFCERA